MAGHRLIVAGSRAGVPFHEVKRAWEAWMTRYGRPAVVLSGCARGVDLAGFHLAEDAGIPVEPFPVHEDEWKRLGGAAGPLRNQRMVDKATALLAVRCRGASPGTDDVVARAKEAGLVMMVIRLGMRRA